MRIWLQTMLHRWAGRVFLLTGLLAAVLVGVWVAASAPAHQTASPRLMINANHLVAIGGLIERSHRSKLDSATMRSITTAIVDAQRDVTTESTSGNVPPRLLYAAGYAGAGTLKTARYIVLPDENGFPIVASATKSQPIEIAQNAVSNTDADMRSYVGQKTCQTCHQQEAGNWAHTAHAKVFGLHPRDATEAQGCEACHGPGSDHIKNPAELTTIISFSSKSKTPITQQNGQCLSCHQGGQRIFWHGSIHDTNKLGCSDCHNPMANFNSHGLTARESVNETCFQCHKDQRAKFGERSHMPLLEGKITCADCHNPHGSTTAPLLKADSVNELCFTCHAEKRGPFLFEHAPVRESCLNCHTPHGSNFEALLTVPRPILCQQCHSQDGHPAQLMTAGNLPRGPMPDPRLLSTSCQTCHVNIHGSNDPSGARFER